MRRFRRATASRTPCRFRPRRTRSISKALPNLNVPHEHGHLHGKGVRTSDAKPLRRRAARIDPIALFVDCLNRGSANRATRHCFICGASQASFRPLPCLLQGLHSPLKVFLIKHAFSDATFHDIARAWAISASTSCLSSTHVASIWRTLSHATPLACFGKNAAAISLTPSPSAYA